MSKIVPRKVSLSWKGCLTAYLFSMPLPVLMTYAAMPLAGGAAFAGDSVRTPVRPDPMRPLGPADYPDASKRANEQGKCVMSFTVTVDGQIVGEAIQTSSGFPRLDEACLKVVHGHRMLPATENGRPVESTLVMPINWVLADASKSPTKRPITCADIDKALASKADEYFDGWTDKDFQSRENPDRCLPQGSIFGIPASIERVKLLRAQAVRTHDRAVDAASRIARETAATRAANQEPLVQKTGSLSTDPEVANAAALFRSCKYAPGSEVCVKKDIAFARLKTENVCVTITELEELRVDFCDHPAGAYVASAKQDVAWDASVKAAELRNLSSGRKVRVFIAQSGQRPIVTGDVVPANALFQILFTEEPCPLDIEGAADMHRAWQKSSTYSVGCWYPTRDDTWEFVGQVASMDRNERMYWEAYPRALLHADGSATITEPNYDAGFSNRVIGQKIREQVTRRDNHLNDKP